MSVLRLSIGGVSFRHRSCVAGHKPGIRVVTETVEKNKEACKHCIEKFTIESGCIDDVTFFFECA